MSPRHLQISRRSLLAGLASSLAGPAFALAPTRSPRPPARPLTLPQVALAEVAQASTSADIAGLLARSGLTGDTGLIALDAETGAVIEEHRADLMVPPASTAKTVTALYALQTLGSEHRFATSILARGTINGGVLAGDLVLQGGGDPMLQTQDLARLADQLIRLGLRSITGEFRVDDTALPHVAQIDRSQPVQAGYNPGLSGLNLNFNRVYFGWETRAGHPVLTMDARSEREVPAVSTITIEAAARDLPVYTYAQQGGRETWTVAATALSVPGSRWLPVQQPGLYAGDVLRVLLATRGCRLPEPQQGSAGSGAAVLALHHSEPLTVILREMLRYSTNLTAECLGLTASARRGAAMRALEPSAARMNAWAAQTHAARGLAFVDHSGLGDGSRVSARAMAQFLLSARRDSPLAELMREHPISGAAGRANAPQIEVRAKTGTLNFVSGLVGYARPTGGRAMVFAILSADMTRRRAIAGDESERPSGTRAWNDRARSLQHHLISRWSSLHG